MSKVRTKYLSELMKDKELESNTLIVSPVGSGKTYWIMNDLCKDKTCLYLCDNNNLKAQVLLENGTREYKSFDTDSNVTVMTYAKFGIEIKLTNEDFINNFDIVICDETHNLIDYQNFSTNSSSLELATEYLIRTYKNTKIIFLTATPEYLDIMACKHPSFGNNFDVIDFTDNEEIMQYTERRVTYIAHYSDIRLSLNEYMNGFNKMGMKCLIYTQLIDNMKKIEDICKDVGLNPICIWSASNQDIEMSKKQLKVREHLIKTGELLEPYNILIINRSMETGVNIYDKNMQLMICNTTNEVQQVQARGRIRHDIDLLILRTNDLTNIYKSKFYIEDRFIEKWLTKSEVETFVINKNNLTDDRGNLFSVNKLIKDIEQYGFEISSKRKKIDGKKITMYYIMKS